MTHERDNIQMGANKQILSKEVLKHFFFRLSVSIR